METDASLRGVSMVLFIALVLGLPWFDEMYNLPLSPLVRGSVLMVCQEATYWGGVGIFAESLLSELLYSYMRPVGFFFPESIRNMQEWVSFWYWYYVKDVAAEDVCVGWNVRGRLRVCRMLLMLCWGPLCAKLRPQTSRYILGEELLCGLEDPRETYTHTPLEASHFRLLRLQARRSRSGLPKCELYAVPLEHTRSRNIAYKCLSYRWGSDERSHSILLNGRSLGVSQTLWDFLDTYRKRSDNDTYLWIDQICINQGDVREKGEQVSQMDSIYKQCEEVIIWLGGCSDSSIGCALHFLHAIQAPRGSAFVAHKRGSCYCRQDLKCMIRNSTSDSVPQPHPALQALLSNPYWSRAWIIQEVILAPRAKIICGTYSIEYVPEQEGLLVHSQHSRHRCGFRPEAKHFFDLVYMHAQRRSRDVEPDNKQGLWRLQDAVRLVKCEARDARDKIFALQGLITPDQRLHIDYTLTKEDLFQELLIALFNHYHEPEKTDYAMELSFDETIDYLLDEIGLPYGLGRVLYNAQMITWCLRTACYARHGNAFYAPGEKHSFKGMSMVQIVEYFYSIADNLHNETTRDWLASRGVAAKWGSMESFRYMEKH